METSIDAQTYSDADAGKSASKPVSGIYDDYLFMLSKYHFTSVSGSVNICLIIIDNILILPKVVKSIFETIYRICRDNKTR